MKKYILTFYKITLLVISVVGLQPVKAQTDPYLRNPYNYDANFVFRVTSIEDPDPMQCQANVDYIANNGYSSSAPYPEVQNTFQWAYRMAISSKIGSMTATGRARIIFDIPTTTTPTINLIHALPVQYFSNYAKGLIIDGSTQPKAAGVPDSINVVSIRFVPGMNYFRDNTTARWVNFIRTTNAGSIYCGAYNVIEHCAFYANSPLSDNSINYYVLIGGVGAIFRDNRVGTDFQMTLKQYQPKIGVQVILDSRNQMEFIGVGKGTNTDKGNIFQGMNTGVYLQGNDYGDVRISKNIFKNIGTKAIDDRNKIYFLKGLTAIQNPDGTKTLKGIGEENSEIEFYLSDSRGIDATKYLGKAIATENPVNGEARYTVANIRFGFTDILTALIINNNGSTTTELFSFGNNRPPIAVEDNVYPDPNQTSNIYFLDNDYDPDYPKNTIADNKRIIMLPKHGTITNFDNLAKQIILSNHIAYTPDDPNFIGTDSIKYEISDSGTPQYMDTATVYIYLFDPCESVRSNQKRMVDLVSPEEHEKRLWNGVLSWRIDSVPPLTVETDAKHTVILQILAAKYDAQGRPVFDWENSKGASTVYLPGVNPLQKGNYSDNLNNYFTASTAIGYYFWRVGIQYERIATDGHQAVAWSEINKFELVPEVDDQTTAAYLLDDDQHTNDINWEYTKTFLDNNETGESIKYSDGLSKVRQTQLKKNTENRILCTETVYSEESPAQVQTLPAPLPFNLFRGPRFGYAHRFFDVSTTNGEQSDFSTKDFDRELVGAKGNTVKTATAVSPNTLGSLSRYYSSLNPDLSVDDAGGYPYTYTLNYKSPVDRVQLSPVGAGDVFRLGAGKENKHFYDHPSFEELARVYGKLNAPPAINVLREIVFDPNGVGSVSYKDNEGKLIATALTACEVPSLDTLNEDGKKAFTIHVNPIATDKIDSTSLKRLASSRFFIPCNATEAKIAYQLDLNSLRVDGYPCDTCLIDYDLSVTNDITGELIASKSGLIKPSKDLCNPVQTDHRVLIDSTLILNGPATYTITRTISPHQANANAENYLTEKVNDYINQLNKDKSQLYLNFISETAAQEDFFMLRKTLTERKDMPPPLSASYTVTNVSGNGFGCHKSGIKNSPPNFPINDGQYDYAAYRDPIAMTKNPVSGLTYYLDRGSQNVRVDSANGFYVIDFAGEPCVGGAYIDGNRRTARFNDPWDIVFRRQVVYNNVTYPDALFVSDRGNNRIRKITLNGDVSTFAGQNGEFLSPEGMCVGNDGFIYVTSSGNNKIYKISPDGVVTLISGTGVAGNTNGAVASASFNQPSDIAINNSTGALYITEHGNHSVRCIKSGLVSLIAGSASTVPGFVNGIGIQASFNNPFSIACNNYSQLYISDKGNHSIRKINLADFSVTTIAGNGTAGYTKNTSGSAAKFNSPAGLFIGDSYSIHVADAGNYCFRKAIDAPEPFNPCPSPGACKEYLWYPDKITIADNQINPYTNKLEDLDGDANNDGIMADENYRILGYNFIRTVPRNDNVFIDFRDAYNRVNWRTGDDYILDMKLYQVNGGELSSTTIATIDDQKMLNQGDQQPYYLLKVRYKNPSCEETCIPITNPKPCREICEQQRQVYFAELTTATYELNNSYNYYAYRGANYRLRQMVEDFYPLADDGIDMLDTADFRRYNDYHDKRNAFDYFDVQTCVNLCNGEKPTPCEVCQPNYAGCVFENMSQMFDGYNYVTDFWDAESNTSHAFPFALTDLVTVVQKANSTETYEVPDEKNLDKLGKILFDYIVTNLKSNNPNLTNRDKWNEKNAQCSNCDAPIHINPYCATGPGKDMSTFPALLMPALESANARCEQDYADCFRMNGSTTDQHNFFCDKDRDNCMHSGLTPEQCDSIYQACINDPSTASEHNYRSTTIRRVVADLYPDENQAAFVDAKVEQILQATNNLTLLELEKYLIDFESSEHCLLDCKRVQRSNFDVWLQDKINRYKVSLREQFIKQCYGGLNEVLDLNYKQSIYHYTLYRYDRKGNLTSTIPPDGIDFVDIESADPAKNGRVPVHRMITNYGYSSLYNLSSTTPDGGRTDFVYDGAGHIRFSQSADQAGRSSLQNKVIFSYTLYDVDERIIEAGEYVTNRGSSNGALLGFRNPSATPGNYVSDYAGNPFWPSVNANKNSKVFTLYDNPTLDPTYAPAGFTQSYLHGRVSAMYTTDQKTHYSYDAHGRVNAIVHEMIRPTGYLFKTVEYAYEALTSRVKMVTYQRNKVDEFNHRYTYDSDGKITLVEISTDGRNWKKAASYEYFVYGPLKRTVIGDNLQNMDFTYTINGWLKAINHPLQADAGRKDVYAEVLNYFSGDYKHTGSGLESTAPVTPAKNTNVGLMARDLYNGNVAGSVQYTGFDQVQSTANTNNIIAQAYQYDYLNRLTYAYTETSKLAASPAYQSSNQAVQKGVNDPYAMGLTYDANGNILSLIRNSDVRTMSGTSAPSLPGLPPVVTSVNKVSMDSLNYRYNNTTTDFYGKVKKTKNRLAHVNDQVNTALDGLNDIQNQATNYVANNTATHNYLYDEKGRLIRDKQAEIDSIVWTPYDKILRIKRANNSTQPNLEFAYDGKQQRISKSVIYPAIPAQNKKTYYMYDGNGQLLSTYNESFNAQGTSTGMSQGEVNIYGSARLGLYQADTIKKPVDSTRLVYELADHLGNVHATLSGKALNTTATQVLSLNDYYAFGMLIPKRQYNSQNYRFGFNGKENDNEVKGTGNQQDYGFRIYDGRLARFLSVDPLFQTFPWYTPYQFAGNTPIQAIDLDGLESKGVIRWYDNDDKYKGSTVFEISRADAIQSTGTLIRNGNASNQASFNKNIFKNSGSDRLSTSTKSALFNLNGNGNAQALKGGMILESSPNVSENQNLFSATEHHYLLEEKPKDVPFVDANNTQIVDHSQINTFADMLCENPDYAVEVTGHASNNDNSSESRNIDLSNERANSIKDALVSRGVNQQKIVNLGGKGSSVPKPNNNNSTESNRVENRRGEVQMVVPRDSRYD